MYIDYLTTPIGEMKITANDAGLLSAMFDDNESKENTLANQHTIACRGQLEEYFAGTRQSFDLFLANTGTNFQQQVWQALMALEYGATASYQHIANAISNPNAVRAVGAANGKNPMFIIVPCHRVVGADGSLTGYAGGVERKQWLLAHEQQYRGDAK